MGRGLQLSRTPTRPFPGTQSHRGEHGDRAGGSPRARRLSGGHGTSRRDRALRARDAALAHTDLTFVARSAGSAHGLLGTLPRQVLDLALLLGGPGKGEAPHLRRPPRRSRQRGDIRACVLPTAIARGLKDTVRGDMWGAARAGEWWSASAAQRQATHEAGSKRSRVRVLRGSAGMHIAPRRRASQNGSDPCDSRAFSTRVDVPNDRPREEGTVSVRVLIASDYIRLSSEAPTAKPGSWRATSPHAVTRSRWRRFWYAGAAAESSDDGFTVRRLHQVRAAIRPLTRRGQLHHRRSRIR